MTWVTGAEASAITNQTVSSNDVDAAHPVIELYSNITTEASATLKPSDLRLLRYAESWQAYWQATQIDVLSRMDADNISQDGVAYSKGNEDALILAPLARRCLLQLSWRRSRTILPLTPEQALRLRGFRSPDTDLTGAEEWLDDRQSWAPLHGGGY